MEAALSTPSIFGRVALAQTMRDIAPDLMDILGPASALPIGTDGAADDGAAEYVYRFAPLVGHLRRHAGGVPQHDRAVRARSGQAQLLAAEEGLLTHRVVHCGTGNIGAAALRAILEHPDLELIGHVVNTPGRARTARPPRGTPLWGPQPYGRAVGSA